MRVFGFLIVLFFVGTLSAQNNVVRNLEENVSGQGKVTIHQSEEIAKLLGGQQQVTKTKPSVQHAAHPSSASNDDSSETSKAAKTPKTQKPSSTTHVEDDGTITLNVEDGEEQTPQKIIKMAGYRVQVYAGNNTRTAKNEASRVANNVRENFPEVPVYSFFYSPRWLCRVGDFRSMEEAYTMLRKLKATGKFHEASIVKDRVNVKL